MRWQKSLIAAGVDNLQTFQTVLRAPSGELPPIEYVAVNILGCVAAADLNLSSISPDTPERLISTDFDALAIDERAARQLLMFRLAQNTSAVLVHRLVKQSIDAAGIQSLTWLRPEEWAG